MNKPTALMLIAALTLLTFSNTAVANQNDDECDGSTADMYECTAVELKVADLELNKIYQAHRAVLHSNQRSDDTGIRASAVEMDRRLVSAQRAWITFRDADCSLQSVEMLGGTGEGLMFHGCLLGKTRERLKQLKDYSF